MSTARRHAHARAVDAELVLGTEDASLLDIVDNVLNKGVVLSGDITIALAQVDLSTRGCRCCCAPPTACCRDEDADFMSVTASAAATRRARGDAAAGDSADVRCASTR